MRKILVTGGFGGIGQQVVKNLLERDNIEIIIFDIANKINTKVADNEIFRNNKITIVWGDITKKESIPDLSNFDSIVHMAFIIPPKSEILPEHIVEKVNIGGMKNLIARTKEDNFSGKFILASSVSVYGPTLWAKEPIRIDRPVNPSDRYSSHKAICEELLRNSGLKWLILRISAAINLRVDLNPENLNIMYAIPYEQKFEFIHPDDAAYAFCNAACCDAENEIFHIAGGKDCQMKYHEMLEGLLKVFNLPKPNKSKFTTSTFYVDYYDTKRSQEILKFQRKDFNDFLADFESNLNPSGKFIKVLAPIAKYFI